MKNAPRLLRYRDTACFPRELFSDLQLDKILSAHAVSILQKPCETAEAVRRNELFEMLENRAFLERVENLRSVLTSLARGLQLLRDAKILLDRYHRYAEVLSLYVESCEMLASMDDVGSLFADVANAYSTEEEKTSLANVKKTAQKIRQLLEEVHTGLLSFSDKCWLTPDCDAVGEFDRICFCASSLGFSVPQKKRQNAKINIAFSDAMCHLHANAVDEIETEMARLADVDLSAPVVYLDEIKFYLEIHSLTKRAQEIGVPHVFAKVAKAPQYIARDLYDISLLAKKCECIVPNDVELGNKDPFCFLLGANGGGKTTYLRALGINLLLFLGGCPVFAERAELYPFDRVFAHFPKDERFESVGRLEEERQRVAKMLVDSQNQAVFLLFNETFSGTDETRGFDMLKNTAEQIARNGHLRVFVTHFHEVMSLDFPVLSAEVDLSDKNRRTYRIVRAKGATSSYAADILKKYGLDRESLLARRHGNEN